MFKLTTLHESKRMYICLFVCIERISLTSWPIWFSWPNLSLFKIRGTGTIFKRILYKVREILPGEGTSIGTSFWSWGCAPFWCTWCAALLCACAACLTASPTCGNGPFSSCHYKKKLQWVFSCPYESKKTFWKKKPFK